MESAYLETTFISYLVARLSRDLLVAAHQQITQEWWTVRRSSFKCCVSEVVIEEASVGDGDEVEKRLAVLADLPALDLNDETDRLARAILSLRVLPPKGVRDAAHIAVAAFHGIDYLLTWNCRHLANAQIAPRIESACERLGYRMPKICTPEELMGI
jgi:predicted nucleic acid-binding protein